MILTIAILFALHLGTFVIMLNGIVRLETRIARLERQVKPEKEG